MAAVWFCREFLSDPTLAALKARLTLSSNDSKKHESTITSYAEGVNQLLRLYAIEAVISKSDEDIRNFKEGCLTT